MSFWLAGWLFVVGWEEHNNPEEGLYDRLVTAALLFVFWPCVLGRTLAEIAQKRFGDKEGER